MDMCVVREVLVSSEEEDSALTFCGMYRPVH